MSNNLHPVILVGNTVESLQKTPANSIQLCVTSPPYWAQRDYGVPPTNWPEITFIPAVGLPPLTVKAMSCCLGLEPNHWDYIGHMVYVFREVKRVLRHDGLLFLNLGDSYACKATGNIGKKSTLNGLLDPNTQQQVGKKSFTQKASAKRPDKTGLPTGNM